MTPLPLGISNDLPWSAYGFFMELHVQYLFSYSTVRNPKYYELIIEKSFEREHNKTHTKSTQAHLIAQFICFSLFWTTY